MIKLGIVGWGYWGRNYAKYFDTTIDASLTHVCDLRDAMLKDATKCYPHLVATKDMKELVGAVDAVIIAVPASLHAKVAEFFIGQGVPLLIEKPLTNSYLSAYALAEEAQKKNVKVLMGHTFVYNQAVQWVQAAMKKRYFGTVYYMEFKRQSYGPIRDDVNIIWDFAPHDVAIASLLLKDVYPETISVTSKSYSRNTQDDIAVISMEYPGNILVNINVAWLYPTKIRSMTLLGKRRMAVFEDTNPVEPLKVYDSILEYPSEKDPYGVSFRLGDVLIPRIKPVDPLYTQLKHFVGYLKGQEKPITPITDGLQNVLLLEALNDASHMDRKLDFAAWIKKKKYSV